MPVVVEDLDEDAFVAAAVANGKIVKVTEKVVHCILKVGDDVVLRAALERTFRSKQSRFKETLPVNWKGVIGPDKSIVGRLVDAGCRFRVTGKLSGSHRLTLLPPE